MYLKKSLGLALAALAVVGGSFMAFAASGSTAATSKTTTATKIVPVHINTATLAQLETLPGVGPKLAQEIIKHRPYKNAQQLQSKVKGIGPTLWKKIAPYVLFN
ncbi:ComEA family DNA-binding protein [Calidithermus timidus]|jgi:competence protein ComEA|uniref:ComEA family DNA-binding protein n=1 Tax=Calidithermus timidus TaxID=307124 RepID=UPI000364E1BF|nr:helix-hairpin-helix domain-containing protein [Calidithermus timidus]